MCSRRWQGTGRLPSRDLDLMLWVQEMRAVTILSRPTVAWVRRKGQAGGHCKWLGSVMTMLMASLQITWVKPHARQRSQRTLHRLSASRIRPQTSQQAARLFSVPSIALCPRPGAAGQDPHHSSNC